MFDISVDKDSKVSIGKTCLICGKFIKLYESSICKECTDKIRKMIYTKDHNRLYKGGWNEDNRRFRERRK